MPSPMEMVAVAVGGAAFLAVVSFYVKSSKPEPKPPPPCPKCKSPEKVVPAVFGPPRKESLRLAREGKIFLGGVREVPGTPDFHCRACNFTFWSNLDAPIR